MQYTCYTAGILFLVVLMLMMLKTSQLRRRNPGGLPFPPGPKGYPIIGSLLSMPLESPWLVYNAWQKVYVFGQSFLIIESSNTWNDLFDKRSDIYSDRPKMPMVVDLMGWGFSVAFSCYGTWWKKQRRAFHGHFNPTAVQRYRYIQIEETRNFLRLLLATPDDFIRHIRHVFVATILRISYGICMRKMYIPERFPGASFEKKARNWRELNEEVVNLPFNFAKDQLRSSMTTPSVASSLIDRLPEQSGPKYEETCEANKRRCVRR
ncbi:cytochrome P450 [Panaeolus papilionaceus]|nr:cytochrome P450 [Panaeolus papilionaceus]